MRDDLERNSTSVRVLNLVGVWVETFLYGVYIGLIIVAAKVSTRRNRLEGLPSKVFLAGNLSMFLLISLHTCLSIYRMIVAFVHQAHAQDPVLYLYDMTNWRNLSGIVVEVLIVWIGDILVIYRCFLVWQRSYWVIALPLILFLLSAITHLMAVRLVGQEGKAIRLAVQTAPVLIMSLPLCLAQNVVTTGLIIFKIWSQYTQTKVVGLTSLHGVPLLSVIRIIIESASIYTVELLIFFILQVVSHPGRFFVHYLLVPSTGITFVLLTIRAQALREEAKEILISASLIPSFLFDRQQPEGSDS